MTEMPGNRKCPVTSYITYINALSPKSYSLWQTLKFTDFPQDPVAKPIWFYGTLGHNKLESFVSDLAYLCGIERGKYTNHSLRHTAITHLKKIGHSDKQVMSTSGHKSSASLNIYQHVDEQEKTKMGITLGEILTTTETNPHVIRKKVEVQYQQAKMQKRNFESNDRAIPLELEGPTLPKLMAIEIPEEQEIPNRQQIRDEKQHENKPNQQQQQ